MTTPKVIKAIELFFQEGSSDKIYTATLVEEGGLFSVNVEWGRRNSPLNKGKKAVSVPLAKAEKAFDKVVHEKTSKGYEAVTGAVAPAAVAPAVVLDRDVALLRLLLHELVVLELGLVVALEILGLRLPVGADLAPARRE
jgi:predicted DNA-binding WGR domain protein